MCSIHWENYISISFHIEWDMIVGTVFLSILNQMDFLLVQNRKENCHHDHIPFNLKGNGNIVFSMYALKLDVTLVLLKECFFGGKICYVAVMFFTLTLCSTQTIYEKHFVTESFFAPLILFSRLGEGFPHWPFDVWTEDKLARLKKMSLSCKL